MGWSKTLFLISDYFDLSNKNKDWIGLWVYWYMKRALVYRPCIQLHGPCDMGGQTSSSPIETKGM